MQICHLPMSCTFTHFLHFPSVLQHYGLFFSVGYWCCIMFLSSWCFSNLDISKTLPKYYKVPSMLRPLFCKKRSSIILYVFY